jgi:hypothetical protein
MNADDLRQLIDRELKQLPAPRAPETLLPRVLRATVGRRPAPWYARPWLAWPRGWQIASAAALVAIGAGLSTFIAFVLQAPAGAAPAMAANAPGRVQQIFGAIEEAATLMRVLWQVLLEPAAFWLVVVAVSLSLACAAIWSALERTAAGGASQQ